MFKTGYILNPQADLVWFLGLPFFAVALALGFQAWLPYVAVASINLWITIPHHYAGWVRSYGMPDVWERFKDRLIFGPIASRTPHDFWEMACSSSALSFPAPGISRSITNFGMVSPHGRVERR